MDVGSSYLIKKGLGISQTDSGGDEIVARIQTAFFPTSWHCKFRFPFEYFCTMLSSEHKSSLATDDDNEFVSRAIAAAITRLSALDLDIARKIMGILGRVYWNSGSGNRSEFVNVFSQIPLVAFGHHFESSVQMWLSNFQTSASSEESYKLAERLIGKHDPYFDAHRQTVSEIISKMCHLDLPSAMRSIANCPKATAECLAMAAKATVPPPGQPRSKDPNCILVPYLTGIDVCEFVSMWLSDPEFEWQFRPGSDKNQAHVTRHRERVFNCVNQELSGANGSLARIVCGFVAPSAPGVKIK